MPTCGIYKLSIIGNDDQERFYYGRSVDVERRIGQHIRSLVAGRHRNSRVQAAYLLYNNVSYSIVAVCDEDVLHAVEGMFVHTHHRDPMCMNFEIVDPNGAVRMCEETKRKIGAAQLGREKSEEERRKIAEANRIRGPVSEETRRRMSAAKLGRRFTREHRDRIGESNSKSVEMLGPSGERVVFKNLSQATRHFGLRSNASLSVLLRGHKPWPTSQSSALAGWTGRYIEKESVNGN